MSYSKKNRAVAAELIAKATQDLQFRKAFIDDPKTLLIDAGAELDDDVEIRVIENTDKIRYILLPALPSSVGDLTDEQLALIAGGGSTSATQNVVGNTEAVANVVGATEGAAVNDGAVATIVVAAGAIVAT